MKVVLRKLAFLTAFVLCPTLLVCADAKQFMWALYLVALIGFLFGVCLIAEDEQ